MSARATLPLAIALAITGCGRCGSPPTSALTPDKANETTSPGPAARKPARPTIIDVHTHVGPDAYDMALRLADEHGVARFVNLSGGHQGRAEGLKPHLDAMKAARGRVAVFYNVDWSRFDEEGFGQSIADGLADAVAQGYAGLKISKALGLGVTDREGAFVAVDDPRLDPIWARAGALGVPVSIHTGDPRAFFEPLTPENERFEELSEAPDWSFADPRFPRREVLLAQRARVLSRHPSTTFILVHFGNNPEDIEAIDRLLDDHPNAVLDVAARLGEIGRHDPARVRRFFIKHQRRVLFGSDFGVHARSRDGQRRYSLFLGSVSKETPTLESAALFFERHWRFFEGDPATHPEIPHPIPIQGRWPIHPIDLPPEVLRAVYGENALRIIFKPLHLRLGIEDPASAPLEVTP